MKTDSLQFSTLLLKRDVAWEENAILCSSVDLILRNHAQSQSLRQYIPGMSFLSTGEVVLASGQVEMSPLIPFGCNRGEIPALPFSIQPGCEPLVERKQKGRLTKILNGDSVLAAKFFMLRLFGVEWSICSILTNPYLIDTQVQLSWDARDIEIAMYLGARLGLTGDWNWKVGLNGPWSQAPPPMLPDVEVSSELIQIRNSMGACVYALQVFYLTNGRYAVLPAAYFQNPLFSTTLKLFIPPAPPYVWMNSEALGLYPGATVILTNDVMLTKINPSNPEFICLGNPGGHAWIDKIDIQSLVGRRVICDLDGNVPEDLRSTLALTARLNSYGITPSFALRQSYRVLPPPPFGVGAASRITVSAEVVPQRAFIKRAQALGHYIPESIRLDRFGAIDLESIQNPVPLLEGLLTLGGITVVSEDRKVEPNIMSSRILAALLAAVNPFSKHCHNPTRLGVRSIAFIDVERRRGFVELMRKGGNSAIDMDSDILFEPRFLNEGPEDGLRVFRGIINSTFPQAVVFDTESIRPTEKRILLLKESIRLCLTRNIAVVIVVRDKRVRERLPQPDRHIKVWKHGELLHAHVVEFATSGRDEPEPFQFHFSNGEWVSETFPGERLSEIPDWAPDAVESGISQSFVDDLESSSMEELLGLGASSLDGSSTSFTPPDGVIDIGPIHPGNNNHLLTS